MAQELSERVLHLKFSEVDFKPAELARPELNHEAVAKYGRIYEEGGDIKAPIVFYDGRTHWGADGRHRKHGAHSVGKKSIKCLVRNGSFREAELFAMHANAEHGVPLSDGDIRRNVERLLEDDEWSQWPTKKIAEHCGCGQRWVQKIKQERAQKAAEQEPTPLITNPGTALSRPEVAAPVSAAADAADEEDLGKSPHELLGDELAAEMSEKRQTLLAIKKWAEEWQEDVERHHLIAFRLPADIGKIAWALEQKKPLGTCPACDGSGEGAGTYDGRLCKWCHGTGFFDREQRHERKNEVHFSTSG